MTEEEAIERAEWVWAEESCVRLGATIKNGCVQIDICDEHGKPIASATVAPYRWRRIAAYLAAMAEAPPTSWTCFHCGETFTDSLAALEHFGPSGMSDAACQIDIKAFREMEEFTARCRAEDSDTDRAMYRMRAENTVALRREEEAGYAKGLADARKELAEAPPSEAEVESALAAYFPNRGKNGFSPAEKEHMRAAFMAARRARSQEMKDG